MDVVYRHKQVIDMEKMFRKRYIHLDRRGRRIGLTASLEGTHKRLVPNESKTSH